MIKIEDIEPGKSYAAKFKVETMLDTLGRPAPNLSDTPLAGVSEYQSLGVLQARDMDQRLVQLKDERSGKEFVVPFDNLWDIDDVEWIEPLESTDGTEKTGEQASST
jgi:hypothetical protein